MRWWTALAGALALCAGPALASEDLVSGLSQDTVEITSNYTGTDIVVFGAIEHLEDTGVNDVVVVVRGPDADMIVRKKDRIAGIFLNRDQARLQGMPSYYFIASTRPVDKIAASYTLQRYAIGLSNIMPESFRSHHDPEPFRLALIAHKQHDGLYGETQSGVELLSPTLFRARIPVPATVPRGPYKVDVYLFRDGTVISAQSTPLFIDQTGLERRLYNFAHESPLSYGLSTVLMATLLGWLSSVVFRRND
ncbi:MAG TPA: TIGR02186 family protein [Rhizomicrobium sp.]